MNGNTRPRIEVVEFADRWAADFARLNYEWIEKFFSVEKHDREILDNPKKWVLDAGGQIFTAVVAGRAAGTVAMIPASDRVVELTKMAVSPSFQRLGIGRQLMRRCIQFAEDRGFAKIFLETHSSLAPAISLYRKFGFVEVPSDPNSLYARADVRMELALMQSE